MRFSLSIVLSARIGAWCVIALMICAPLNARQTLGAELWETPNTGQDSSLVREAETQPWIQDTKNEEAPRPPQTNLNSFDSNDGTVTQNSGNSPKENTDLDWLSDVKVGYDGGFVVASERANQLEASDYPFQMKINGWGQLRQTLFDSEGASPDANQFQLKRARLIFSGSAYTSDFSYFFQFDGRSSSGDDFRLLDYRLEYDFGHHRYGLEPGAIGFRTGKYKMPFHMARYLSGREFEFTDRSMASTYFDVNRSLAWGLYGRTNGMRTPINWEVAVFNGLVTGGAETGSSGSLDSNFAYSTRVYWYPTGEWGEGQLADFDGHCQLATRMGAGFARSTIDRIGTTEFSSSRTVDAGVTLESILPGTTNEYTVNLYSLDASMKYFGWSLTMEYYFRQINNFQGAAVPDLLDHGHWLQIGKFVVPEKFQLLARWSRVVGDSGTLGALNQSSDEIAGGFAWYVRDQSARLTVDATWLDGAPINSSSLDISPGDIGLQFRTQIQFSF